MLVKRPLREKAMRLQQDETTKQDTHAQQAEPPDHSAHAVYAARMLVMAAALQLLDAAQRAVRTTTAPALAVSLAEIHYPGEAGYCPGVMVTRLNDLGVGDAVTIEVGTELDEAGRVRPSYRLRGLGRMAGIGGKDGRIAGAAGRMAGDASDPQSCPADAIARVMAVFSNQATHGEV